MFFDPDARRQAPRPPCPDCGGVLDLSQPDPLRPDRILGACRRCGAWFRFDDDRTPGRCGRGRPA